MRITVFLSLFLITLSTSVVHGLAHAEKNKIVRLATTTSTENSGLLTYLLPSFEKQSGYKVHVIAIGTGKALRMGRDGDVDVLLVHAPKAEVQFVESGFGIERISVMHNDFVIVGSTNDPAKLSSTKSLREMLQNISNSENTFVSRGDNSGTHKKELGLWKTANIEPKEKWYREVGQGMGKVLQIAGEMDAYTLTDRGTWLAYKDKSPLKIVFEGDKQLFNPYSIMAINPDKYADLNHSGANAFILWITSADAQKMIGEYKLHGQALFTPDSKSNKNTTAQHL